MRTTATFNISFGIGRKTVEDCNSSLKASIAGLTKPLTKILEERYSCWKTKDDFEVTGLLFLVIPTESDLSEHQLHNLLCLVDLVSEDVCMVNCLV